jgi:hypothetical protein
MHQYHNMYPFCTVYVVSRIRINIPYLALLTAPAGLLGSYLVTVTEAQTKENFKINKGSQIFKHTTSQRQRVQDQKIFAINKF